MASPRMMLFITQIARMRLTGVKPATIARALNLKIGNYNRIVSTADYHEYEEALLAGHLSRMDEKLGNNRDLMDKTLRVARGAAISGIIEMANQRKDLKTALAACKDILRIDPDKQYDIDGRAVRVSPSQITGQPGGEASNLPNLLFDAISKDADNVRVAVAKKIASMEANGKTDA